MRHRAVALLWLAVFLGSTQWAALGNLAKQSPLPGDPSKPNILTPNASGLGYTGIVGERVDLALNDKATKSVINTTLQFIAQRLPPRVRIISSLVCKAEKEILYYTATGEQIVKVQVSELDPKTLKPQIVYYPLVLGANYIISLELELAVHSDDSVTPDSEVVLPTLHQTHDVVLFRDIDRVWALTSHTFFESSEPRQPLVVEFGTHPNLRLPTQYGFSALFASAAAVPVRMRPAAAPDGTERFQRMRVASYNIWNFNEPWSVRVDMLATELLQQDADIIGLQEVRYDYSRKRRDTVAPGGGGWVPSGRFQVEDLAARMPQYQYVWRPSMTYLQSPASPSWHVDEGLAVLSKWPIVEVRTRRLSRNFGDPEDGHQRNVLGTVVDTPAGPLAVFVTHLSLSWSARERTATELCEFTREPPFSELPAVLVGDFNGEPDDIAVAILTGKQASSSAAFSDAWHQQSCPAAGPAAATPAANHDERGYTFSSMRPHKRIDYVLVRGQQLGVEEVRIFGNTTRYVPGAPLPPFFPEGIESPEDMPPLVWPSDHFGLAAVLAYDSFST